VWYSLLDVSVWVWERAGGLHGGDTNSFTLVFARIALLLARGAGVGTCMVMTQL
jgi:hypothetical protein